jgi:hypothetical protein
MEKWNLIEKIVWFLVFVLVVAIVSELVLIATGELVIVEPGEKFVVEAPADSIFSISDRNKVQIDSIEYKKGMAVYTFQGVHEGDVHIVFLSSRGKKDIYVEIISSCHHDTVMVPIPFVVPQP